MSPVRRPALVGVVALCAIALATADETTVPKGASDDSPPTYTLARVLAIDVMGRTLLIRNVKGVEEKVQLDDNLPGFGDVQAGDRVILTLRTGPGWARVSSLASSGRAQAAPIAASSRQSPAQAPSDAPSTLAPREAFSAKVAGLAAQADGVDRVWDEFRSACDLRAGKPHEGGRGWLAIWEGPIRADLSAGSCRDLFNQIVDRGESIRAGIAAAEDGARSLLPGDMMQIRRQYRLYWDDWAAHATLKREDSR